MTTGPHDFIVGRPLMGRPLMLTVASDVVDWTSSPLAGSRSNCARSVEYPPVQTLLTEPSRSGTSAPAVGGSDSIASNDVGPFPKVTPLQAG